ncbi:MAG: asparagine synthase (glutamine-hydrolyzing) [Bdellovibrionia bacterium]
MCGIAGHVGALTKSQSFELLNRQLEMLHHRGPDAKGVIAEEEFAFGHARLAIIDLQSGVQPMTYSDGELTITYNGEVYNYVELREELERLGRTFRTRSDTEVLLGAYAQWGEKMANRLNGMFAFAIFDKKTKSLFCARDPYGQKPFYYLHTGRNFFFASESRAFTAVPGFKNEVEPESLAHYLAFEGLYFDKSILSGVKKLPPGHFLTFRDGVLKVEHYFENVPVESRLSEEELIETVREKMRDAVRISFRADVPVGLLLSGGLDSTLVLALLREAYPSAKIGTFTIRNEDKTFDESHYAAQAAGLFGTEHSVFDMPFKTLRELASSLPGRFDEPQADPGILPKYYICKEVRKSMKVALTGDGGDEFFYGYLIFKAQRLARLYRMVPGAVHNWMVRPFVHSLPSKRGYMQKDFLLKQFAKGFPSSEAHRNFRWTCSYDETQLSLLLNPEVAEFSKLSWGLSYLNGLDRAAEKAGPVGRLAYKYQRTYLPDYVLVNSDRASMLNSVELRSPLLDTGLTRYVNEISDGIKMPGFRTKGLMKKIAAKYIPRDLIERKKVGFTVPIADLIREDLREEIEEIFSETRLKQQGLFNHGYVRNMLDLHFSARANLYKQIWTLYTLQKWLLERNSR